ncbi:hypothetical protein [Pseudomonas phage vB_Pae_HMKU_23]|nr:hypothetical protein [Pseudomonas phage vB_Pae_HMKU_23]
MSNTKGTTRNYPRQPLAPLGVDSGRRREAHYSTTSTHVRLIPNEQ